MEWSSTALIFPGQGSQHVGMGHDFYQTFDIAREVIQQADDILGYRLSALMFEGPAEQLDQTANTQPAMYVCSIAILRVLAAKFPEMKPTRFAGHSLGEFTALTAANALSFEDGLKLVRARGELMQTAGERQPGAMAALLGLEPSTVAEICEKATAQTKKPVVLANDNCPGQTVISGDTDAIDAALTLAEQAGVRKAVKLAVSVAAHSPLMQSASEAFRKQLDQTPFAPTEAPVYANVSTQPLNTVASVRAELDAQLTGSVRWTGTIQQMIADGSETFIEVGSGDALTGMLKRIDRSKTRIALNSVDALEKLNT